LNSLPAHSFADTADTITPIVDYQWHASQPELPCIRWTAQPENAKTLSPEEETDRIFEPQSSCGGASFINIRNSVAFMRPQKIQQPRISRIKARMKPAHTRSPSSPTPHTGGLRPTSWLPSRRQTHPNANFFRKLPVALACATGARMLLRVALRWCAGYGCAGFSPLREIRGCFFICACLPIHAL